jgi:hypothetical protein
MKPVWNHLRGRLYNLLLLADEPSAAKKQSKSKRSRRRSTRLTGEILEQRRLLAADLLNLPVPMTPTSLYGARGYESSVSFDLAEVGETDEISVRLTMGQSFSLRTLPTSASLRTQVQLLDPASQVIATQSAAVAGSPVSISDVLILADGTYRILVSSSASSGGVALTAYTSVTLESEALTGDNDTFETAESLADHGVTIAAGGTRYLVSGASTNDVDWYKFPVTVGQSIAIDSRLPGSLSLELMDMDGTTIAFADAGSISGYTTRATGELGVRVRGNSLDRESYTVAISLDAALAGSRSGEYNLAQSLPSSGIAYGRLSDKTTSSLRVAVHADPFDGYETGVINQLNDDNYFDFTAEKVTTDQMDTIEELSSYDVVVLGTPFATLTPAAAAALREYSLAGGGIVATGWFSFAYRGFTSGSTVGQPLDEILPITMGSGRVTASDAVVPTSAVHPIMEGVEAFNFDGFSDYFGAIDGDATVLARTNGNTAPAVVVSERGGRSAYLSPAFFWSYIQLQSGNGDRMLEQATAWAARANSVDSFGFLADQGEITITATPWVGSSPLPANTSELSIELYDLDSATPAIPVSVVGPGDAGTAPPVLSFVHSSANPGRYVATVRTEAGSGDYDIIVTNTIPMDTDGQLNVSSTTFPNGPVNFVDTLVTVTFDRPLMVNSVQATDFVVGTTPARSVDFVDGQTVVIDIGNFDIGDGVYAVTIDGITGLDGTEIQPFNASFILDRTPPQITSIATVTTVVGQTAGVTFDLTINEPLDPDSIASYPFRMVALDLSDDRQSKFLADNVNYDQTTNTLTADFSGLSQSRYVFFVDTGFTTVLRDIAGNVLDAAGNGNPFSVLAFPFDVDINPAVGSITSLSPIGAGLYGIHVESVAGETGDADEFVIDVEAGATVSVVADPLFSADKLQVDLLNANGDVVASASSAAGGGRVRLASQVLTEAGLYTVRVTSLTTLGRYSVDVLFGTGLEAEASAGENDTVATSESPEMTPRVLSGTATTTAIAGRIGTATQVSQVQEIGYSMNLLDSPLALTASTGGGFLMSTGNDLYSVAIDGALSYLSSPPVYVQSMLQNGDDLVLGTFSKQLHVVNAVTGVPSSAILMTRENGGSIYGVYSLVRSADDQVYVLFEGSGLVGRALGHLDLATGAITEITSLGQSYSSVALDGQGNLFGYLPPSSQFDSAELHELHFSGSSPFTGSMRFSVVHRFGTSESTNAVIAFDNSGQLFRATGPLQENGGGIERSLAPSPPTTETGDLQRIELTRVEDVKDVHQVMLAAGQWLSLALSRTDVTMELLSPAGQLITLGSVQGNVSAIDGFVAPAAGVYHVRLSTTDHANDYHLVISRDATLALAEGINGQTVPPSGVVYGRSGIGGRVSAIAIDQATSFSKSVFDGGNYLWDMQSNGSINDGTSDAYDVGMVLDGFAESTSGFQDASGRSFLLGPSTLSGLSATRSIYVPNDDTFARFVDSFTNPTTSTIAATISYRTNLGSDGSTQVIATSSGDLNVATDDSWILTDDSSDGSGDPAVGHLFYGPGSLTPSSINRSGDDITWSFPISVAPGEMVSLMSFAVQNFNRASAEATIRRIADLEVGTLDAFPIDAATAIQNWSLGVGFAFDFNVVNPTTVQILTSTPGFAPGLPNNSADPLVRLFNLGGTSPSTPVAIDDNGASDGRNSMLVHTVGAVATGQYGFSVGGIPTGDYVALLSATQPGDIESINVLNAEFPEIVPDSNLFVFPSHIRVTLDEDLNLASVDAGDLRINGVPAQSVSIVDGRTLDFSTFGTFTGDGTYSLVIASGALSSLRGAPVNAITSTFIFDVGSPRVIDSTIVSGATVSPGQLVYQVTFNETLATTDLGPEDFTLTAQGGLAVPAKAVIYDSIASIATVTFEELVENTYTLRIISSLTGVRDLVGNLLDGSPSFPLPSGDGVPGDDFVLNFTVDAETTSLPTPAIARQPIGGRIYETQATALIGQPGDTDRFVVSLAAGQAFFATVQSLSTLTPRVRVFDPNGNEMVTSSAIEGGTISTPLLTATTDGSYAVVVESADTSLGYYNVSVTLGAELELESITGVSNDVIANAQDLTFYVVQPAGAAEGAVLQAAVVGAGGSVDHYRFTATAGRPISLAAALSPSVTGLPAGGLTLIAADGTILAVGSDRADGEVQDIHEFVPLTDGPLIVRVDAEAATAYQLIVADGAAFDVEPNDDGSSAQPLQVATTVLGGIAVGASSYTVDFSDAVGGMDLDQFTATGLWHVTDTCDTDPTGHGAPNFAYFGIDASCNFNAGTVSGTLTSQPLGLRAGTSPVLRMKYRLGSETGQTYDRAEVLVSTNGGETFTKVADKATHFSQASVWTAREIDLSAFAGQSVILRFSFASIDSIANDGLGWQIDDLEVTGVADLEDFYSFPAVEGDALSIRALPRNSMGNQPSGNLIPQLELIGPSGLVVAAGTTDLDYAVPNGSSGRYLVRLIGDGAGDYRIEFSGSTDNRDTVATLLASVPADNQSLADAPTRVRLTFDQGIRIDSIQASDLVFANAAVTTVGVEIIDGSTVAFLVNVPNGVDGNLSYSIAAGAMLDLQGTGTAAVDGSFTIDRIGPKVIGTSPTSQASAPFSTIIFTFDEPLDRDSVNVSDILAFTSPSNENLVPQINSVSVDGANVIVTFNAQNAAGDYRLTIGGNITDIVGNLIDQNENGVGGETADTFTRVISLASPDLRPIVDSVTGTLEFGQTIVVNYTVTNIGNDPALERWRDRIYISTNSILDLDDQLLITSPTTNILGPLDALGGANNSYSRSVNVTLPLASSLSGGTYFLIVKADAGFNQPEANETNNAAASISLAITLPSLPDLAIESVVIPPTAISGQQIPVQWRLVNRGTGDFNGSAIDAIRLSTDNLPGNDTFLANFNFTGSIPAGGSVLRQQLVTLPLATEGQRHLVITADIGNAVFEHLREDNNTTVSSAIDVTLASLPNLRVTSVTPPLGAFSSQPTTVHFVVTNTGTGPTTSAIWYDAVYLSTDGVLDSGDIYLGAKVNPGFLEPAGSYASSLQVTLPRGIQGDYQLIVVTDSNNHVFENQFETDNVKASATFPVTLTPPPDLQVESVSGPFTAFSGSPAKVSWTVTNNGPGRTLETQWLDDVYLSTDTTLDAADVRLGRLVHQGVLNSGASYSVVNQPMMLPVGIAGNYYFIVVTDVFDQVYENVFEQNNSRSSAAVTNVILTPPPDLVPTFDIIPTSLGAGRDLRVTFTVTNNGISPTVENNWVDRLYLSTDATLDENDLLVQSKTHYGNIGVFQSYTDFLDARLPWSAAPGNYYLILATDSTDNVFELENSNNVIATEAAIPLAIEPPDLMPTDLTIPGTLLAGHTISASWTVQNTGVGSTNVSRRDDLVLSLDNVLGNADDIVIKSVTVNPAVLSGATQSVTADNVVIPLALGTGEYHVFVRVDAGNVQFESSEANNSFGPISVAITQMLPDLIADNVTFNPATLTSQGQLTVDWTSRNQGAAVTNTGYWIDRIYLSSDNQFSSEDLHIGSLSQNAVLAAGQSRARQATITIPPEISGDYFVFVDSDANGQVIEGAGESNNATASASTVNITLNPTPDLRVSSVDAPPTAFSGQPINIEWTVTNSGIAPATGNWYDAVYLSADQVFDRTTDTYLGFRNRPTSLSTTGLAAAGSYTQSGRFEIPLGVAGPLYVFVATDSGGSVFERAAELNNSGYDPVPVLVTLLPPADLVVGTITIPPNSDVGATATISYTVRNQGVNPARGQWQDSLFLSADDSFSIDDLPLGVVNHVGDVAGLGGEYTEVLNAKLPGVIPGNYRIIVRSDIRNAIAESSESNNISGSLNAFEINLPTLTLGVPTVGTLSANESLFWTIELAEGDSVRFKLDNASNDATSEIFIRRGAIPSRSAFDFAANVPFTNDPSVVIPVEESGTYYVMSYGGIPAGDNTFSLLAEVVPLSVFDVSASHIGDAGPATVKVSGARFSRDTLFSLVSPTDPTVVLGATQALVQDSITAFVTFNASDFPQGNYVLVAQQEGLIASLNDAVTVVDTIRGDVLVTIDGAPRVLPDRFNPFRLQYTNDGNTDFGAPLFIVENPDRLQIGFTSDDARTLPLQVFGVAPDGDTSVLRPGTIGSIPLVFRSDATGIVNMPIRPIRATDSRIVSDSEWIEIAASIRPQDLTSNQWETFWARVQPRIGATWGSYVRFVQDLHERTKDLNDVRKGDVRSMIRAVFADDPNWRPNSIVSGSLLLSSDATAIAGVAVGAYQLSDSGDELRGAAVTDASGRFTFPGLPKGTYSLVFDQEGHGFDMNRDGQIDGDLVTFEVLETDVDGLSFYVAPFAVEVVQETAPSIAIDSSGVAHLVWRRDEMLWHAVGDGNGGWIDAQSIAEVVGSDPKVIAGDTLVDSGPGLMVTFRSGTNAESELYYVLGKLNATRTAYLWSTPTAITNDMIHDGQFDIALASDGVPVLVTQRTNIGDETTDSDDTDLYSWSQTPTGSFEAALLAEAERAIAQDLAELGELDPNDSAVRIRLQNIKLGPFTIPKFVPIIGGEYKGDFRGSATVLPSGCKAGGKIEMEGRFELSKLAEMNFRGGGQVNYSSAGTKGNCEYEFDNAYGQGGGGLGINIPTAPPIPGMGYLGAELGIRLEAQGNFNFGWDKENPFPSWPQFGPGSVKASAGGYSKGAAKVPFLGEGEVTIRVLVDLSSKIKGGSLVPDGWGVTVLARFQYEFLGYKKFKEFTFTWNPGGSSSTDLALLGGSIDTTQVQSLTANSPENISFGIEPLAPGTLTDYGSSTLDVISQNTINESAPRLVKAPDGTVYGLWSNNNGVGVFQYDALADTWSALGSVGDDAGLTTSDATMEFTDNNHAIIVFAGQDLTGLNASSSDAEIEASFNAGADLYYATFNRSTNTFGNDTPLFAMTGNDTGTALMRTADGNLVAVWTHNELTSASLLSSVFDATTMTWSTTQTIRQTDAFSGKPIINMIAGTPTVMWGEINGLLDSGDYNTNAPQSLRFAKFEAGSWLASEAFSFTEAVSTTKLAVSAEGAQAQLYQDEAGALAAISRHPGSAPWSTPQRLSLGGRVASESTSIAYDASGTAVVAWIEVLANPAGGQDQASVLYSYQRAGDVDWSTPTRVATGGTEIGQLRLDATANGDLVLVWTQDNGAVGSSLRTAKWSASELSMVRAQTIADGVVLGSVSAGRVSGDHVLLWKQVGADERLDRGLHFATLSRGDWGAAVSASSLIHAVVTLRPAHVSRNEFNGQSADQYNMGIAYLLAQHLGGSSILMTGSGVYLHTAGILPFSPPEDCCDCEEFDERTVGINEGCGSTTEIDEENCIRITTYKPCVERPRDPNDILGPEGFGEERWVSSLDLLSYRIRFENAADAGAAAQLVEVIQPLDEDLKLQSFSLKGFGFRGFNFTVPNGPPFYTTVIDMTEELGVLVEFTAGLDVANHEAFWRLVALDPATGQPPLNPDLGLLIPNDANGNGEGYLDYTIKAKPNVATGTRIDAQARIIFDTEEPIDTPPIFNTLDASAPTSGVIAGTAPDEPEFTVMWEGNDDANGSGLASYTILVSVDGGDYSVWLDETTATEAVYTGTPGSSYAFASLAADNANNLEALPAIADWTVTLPGGVATLGDFVWDDLNNNGVQDANEPGLDGVTVTLFVDDGTADGSQVATTVTANGGLYSFPDLDTDASYFMTITALANYLVGQPLQGTDATLDSNFGLDGKTAVFTLNNGENLDFDASLVRTGSIGGAIWEDRDGDGIRDAGEPSLVGWIVYLDLNDNGVLDTSEPTRVSDGSGQYQFDNLRPGTYVVAEIVEPGYVQTYPGTAGASATNRSYVQNGSQAALYLPSLDSAFIGPARGSTASPLAGVASGTVGSAASQWIDLHEFLSDPRFAVGSSGTVVVIDTGIDVDHPFFGPDTDGDGVADRIVFQYDFADRDFDASDRTGHGSHVAGLIAGTDAIYPGIAPDARVIALKVFGDNGRGSFADVERALSWVIQNANEYSIDAINMSIGDGLNWSDTIGGYGISDELAVLADMGVIAVAAAGNSYGLFNTQGLAYPAADPNTISVGAVWDSNRGSPWRFGANGTDYSTAAGRITSFSQRDAESLDVFAPGAILTSANQYGGVSALRGTSMSAPQVTGAAVWAQQLARTTIGRSLTTAEFRYLVRQSGTRLVDGDDENDNVFNTGATFAGLHLVALGEAILAYDGSYDGTGFKTVGNPDGGGLPGTANGRPNRYLIDLAPGQDRILVDFGNKLADSTPPQVIDIVDIAADPRNATVSSAEIELSEKLDITSLDQADFSLTRNGISVPIPAGTLTFEQIPETFRYRVLGLTTLTQFEGEYVLTVIGSGLNDLAGNAGVGSANDAWRMDTTKPTSRVSSFAQPQNTLTFPVVVTGIDPTSGQVASGVASYDVYLSVDGGAWSFWNNLPANSPSANFSGVSNHTYSFYSLARDNAGNVETKTPTPDASTYVPDLNPPETQVLQVGSSTPTFALQMTGSDIGGSGLAFFDLFVQIDNGPAQQVGQYTAGSPVGGIYSRSVNYSAIQDGASHTYRFFTVGRDGRGNVESAPAANQDVVVEAMFDAPQQLEIASFDVQKGAAQRSFVRYVDVTFNTADAAIADMFASVNDSNSTNDRIRLTRRNLDGSGGFAVSLASRVQAVDQVMAFDFGANGIGGNRNSNVGDGYYELEFDLDGDGNFESLQRFYRLLGDVNGSRGVDGTDVSIVTADLGRSGLGLESDANGDGVVNATDRTLTSRASGRALTGGLPLDD